MGEGGGRGDDAGDAPREAGPFKLLDATAEGIFGVDCKGRCTFVNPVALRLLGYRDPAELVGRNMHEVAHHTRQDGTPHPEHECTIFRSLASGCQRHETNEVLWRSDGTSFPAELWSCPIVHEGRLAGAVVTFHDVSARQEIEAQLSRRALLADLRADVTTALTQPGTLRQILQRCAEVMVRRLEVAFARIWVVSPSGSVLTLEASAGMYTHLDGPHGRVPIGELKIGMVARERRPHVSNDVANDPRVSDHEWARREGMVAFAGYPLVVEDRVVGVMGLFARRRLAGEVIEALGVIGDAIAQGIERKRAEDARDRLLREAREAVRERDEFLTLAAHELRTPVTSLQLQVQNALRKAHAGAPTAALLAGLEAAERQVGRVARLIDHLLDISRITAGRVEVNLEPVDLVALVREVVARHRDELAHAGCAVTLELPERLVGTWDRMRLDQVVTNLLSNAMKYGRGKPIGVRLETHDGHAVLTVRDEGIGIPAAHRTRIFQRFERAVSGQHYGGFGLGLWIVGQMLEALGGSIEVESEPGQGAAFVVRLPIPPPASGVVPAA